MERLRVDPATRLRPPSPLASAGLRRGRPDGPPLRQPAGYRLRATGYLYGSIFCSFGASASDTSAVPRFCRFDFVVLLVRMWRLNAAALTIFPLPVFLK